MTSFKIDPIDLGIYYNYIRGSKYTTILKSLTNNLKTQHSKPSPEGWERAYSDLKNKGRKIPLWFTDNNKSIYRWNYNFIETHDNKVEIKYLSALRGKIFRYLVGKGYLEDTKYLVEIGAGSGHNIIGLDWLPFKKYGLDFSQSAVDIMRSSQGINAYLFDMKQPWGEFSRTHNLNNACILTIGAMEQLGEEYHEFLEWMCKFKNICVHIEPIKEFYNREDEFDETAYQYHEKRNYLGEFYTELRKTKREILIQERTTFGNIFNEGYSVIVWTA